MLKRLSGWITGVSTGRTAAAALVIFLLFTAIVLPDQAAKAELSSGSDESPDTSFFYTAKDLYRMAEDYGEEGRSAYIRARFTFDVIWPLVYTAFLITAAGWLARRLAAGTRWETLNLLPLAGMLFDFMENSAASLVFARFPATTPVIDVLTPFFTMLKWIFLGLSFALLAAGAVLAAWKKVRNS